MADLMPGIPSVPGDETSWAAAVDQFETLKKGDIPLSLTNWDSSSTKPAVAAGSAIEVAGAVYRYPAEQAISQSGTAAGTYYVYIAASNGSANFTVSVPEWRADLAGWYNTAGDRRYTGHVMDWDGADAYTNKRVFTVDAPGGEVFNIYADGSLSPIIVDGDVSGVNGNFTGDVSASGNMTANIITTSGINTDNVILRQRVYVNTEASPTHPIYHVSIAHGLDHTKIVSAVATFGSDPNVPTKYYMNPSATSFITWEETSMRLSTEQVMQADVTFIVTYRV